MVFYGIAGRERWTPTHKENKDISRLLANSFEARPLLAAVVATGVMQRVWQLLTVQADCVRWDNLMHRPGIVAVLCHGPI